MVSLWDKVGFESRALLSAHPQPVRKVMNNLATPQISRGATLRPSVPLEATHWIAHPSGTYRCPVTLIPEDEGGFSAISANLPGVASQGETEAEAIENFKDAMAASLASYKAHGEAIPWKEVEESTEGRTLWVLVHG
jgi:predicted RNase H-like HicB family nuclease